MDDLYNNLNVYETKVKGSSSSNQNSQNVAFVSSNNSGSSNQAYGSNSANTDSMSDVVIYSFFATQSNSPQLNDEDLKQIDADDLEEIDLKWQMVKLTMRAKRFLNKIGRKFNTNGSETIGYNKSKVECYNCHKKGHFARECRAPRGEHEQRTCTEECVSGETTRDKSFVLKRTWICLERFLALSVRSDQAERLGSYNFTLWHFHLMFFKFFKLQILRENERYKTNEEYRVVPPPYTGNFMPLKYDLILADEGEYVFSEAKSAVGNPQLELYEKGVINSGCSRHMTRNKSYLSDYKEIDGGFVAFGGDPKGGRITVKEDTNIAGTGPNWLFDIDALTISMNYKPVVAGNQTNGNVGTKENIDAGQDRKKIVPDQKYILLPLLTYDPSLSKSSKDSPDAGFKPSGEEEKIDSEHQENEDKNNAVDENIVYECIDDLNMPNLEEIVYSNDDEEVSAEADMNNLATNVPISPIPTIRVHKALHIDKSWRYTFHTSNQKDDNEC
ncbi:ribonuclease H-like domain-containing protein [Tanacetum coccineum]